MPLLQDVLMPGQGGHVFWRRMAAFNSRDSVLILLVFPCPKKTLCPTSLQFTLSLLSSSSQAIKERVCS